MKVRSDFVTNSSSSSFILAFDSKDVVADELRNAEIIQKFDVEYGHEDIYLQRLLWDIMLEENVRTPQEVLEYAEEDLKYDLLWREQYKLIDEGLVKNIREVNEWVSLNPEAYEERVEKELSKHMSFLEEALEGKQYLVMVEYGDEGGGFYSNLEHEIVPQLESCVAVFNHH